MGIQTISVSLPSPIDCLDITVAEDPFRIMLLFVCPTNPKFNGVLTLPVNTFVKGLTHMLLQSDLELGALSDIGQFDAETFRLKLIDTARSFAVSEGATAADDMLGSL